MANRSAAEVARCKSACCQFYEHNNYLTSMLQKTNLQSLPLGEPFQVTLLCEGAGV